jgi:hypothetical protein
MNDLKLTNEQKKLFCKMVAHIDAVNIELDRFQLAKEEDSDRYKQMLENLEYHYNNGNHAANFFDMVNGGGGIIFDIVDDLQEGDKITVDELSQVAQLVLDLEIDNTDECIEQFAKLTESKFTTL